MGFYLSGGRVFRSALCSEVINGGHRDVNGGNYNALFDGQRDDREAAMTVDTQGVNLKTQTTFYFIFLYANA